MKEYYLLFYTQIYSGTLQTSTTFVTKARTLNLHINLEEVKFKSSLKLITGLVCILRENILVRILLCLFLDFNQQYSSHITTCKVEIS
jgi:hypothetical protein